MTAICFAFFCLIASVLPASAAGIPVFSGERALELAAAQCEFGPRNPGSAGAKAALAWMTEQLKASAPQLRPHAFSMPDPYAPEESLHLTNLVASFRPEATRRIALAAHWDTRAFADQEEGERASEPILGANDGASGVAVLLALAELMAQEAPSVGIDLLFFDGEDYGREGDSDNYLLGSRRFVADHPAYRPEALILLDMVGEAGLNIPMELYGLQNAPELTRLVFGRASALGLWAFESRPGDAVLDDHIPFLQAGIPAIDLIDLDYDAWHTHADTMDKLSAESLRQVGQLLCALIYLDFAN